MYNVNNIKISTGQFSKLPFDVISCWFFFCFSLFQHYTVVDTVVLIDASEHFNIIVDNWQPQSKGDLYYNVWVKGRLKMVIIVIFVQIRMKTEIKNVCTFFFLYLLFKIEGYSKIGKFKWFRHWMVPFALFRRIFFSSSLLLCIVRDSESERYLLSFALSSFLPWHCQ